VRSNELNEQAAAPTYHTLLILASVALMVMPFLTTVTELMNANELAPVKDVLTSAGTKLNLGPILDGWVVPMIVRMVAVLVRPLGLQTVISQSSLYITGWDKFALVYISWNCIGWQSLVLFLVTLITGLRGPFTWSSKIHCLLLGGLGTFLMNLVRIVLVSLVALLFGRLPAVLFHDYAGTLLTILWLLTFWLCAYAMILERKDGQDEDLPEEAESLYAGRGTVPPSASVVAPVLQGQRGVEAIGRSRAEFDD